MALIVHFIRVFMLWPLTASAVKTLQGYIKLQGLVGTQQINRISRYIGMSVTCHIISLFSFKKFLLKYFYMIYKSTVLSEYIDLLQTIILRNYKISKIITKLHCYVQWP